MGPLLSFIDVGTGSAYYGFEASLSFDVYAGQVVSLDVPERLGVTIARMVRGEVEPTTGSAFLLGRDITTMGPAEIRRAHSSTVATLPSFPRVDDSMSVREWLMQKLLLRGLRPTAAAREVVRALSGAGREDLGIRYPAELSATEIRWTSLLHTLIGEPRLVVAESEAFGTDPRSAAAMIGYARDWCTRTRSAVLWPTHWLRGACMATRMLVYSAGRCVDADED
ncbi:MAG: hypothetical protein K1X95_15995 [Acidimicrobiia bacterium]|nr:hypothetical protein [Acidimicrobiia bacterium]